MSLVVFDFDGTLFRLPADWDGLRAELGLPAGGRISDWMQRSIDAGQTEALDVATRYELAAVADGEFTAGARELLTSLPLHCSTAILTRNSTACVRAALGELAKRVRIVGREDVRRLKPDPEGLRTILTATGVPAGRCVLVGDTFHDVQAARAAGAVSFVVTNPELAHRPDGADRYLDSLLEFPAMS